MQAIDGDAASLQPLGEIEGEHHLRELALHVGAAAGIGALEHDVVEVDRPLADRGDVDDAGRRAFSQQRQQMHRQGEAGEVVDREPQLDAGGVDLSPRARSGADPGVVDQQIEPRRGLRDPLGEAAHGGEVGEVSGEKSRAAAQRNFRRPITTEIVALEKFWPAEDYHQDYFAQHPEQGYCQVVIAPKIDHLREELSG